MLFEVLGDGWADLDRKEGHPRAYRRRQVAVLDEQGEAVEAVTYIAGQDGFFSPSEDYLGVVRRGMEAFGVDGIAMLNAAAAGASAPCAIAGLFVYGTLLACESRAHHLASEARLPARMRGSLRDCGAYPALVQGEGWVQGEIVELTDAARTLPLLDRIEGFPGFGAAGALFHRTLAPAEWQWPESPLAWVYRYAGPTTFPAIEGGSWRARSLPASGTLLADALARLRVDLHGLSDLPVVNFDPTSPGRVTWGGADVVVTDGALTPPEDAPWSRHLRNLQVVTPHALPLALLMLRLRDEVYPHGQPINKYEFYGRIGQAVVTHHATQGWSNQRATLLEALDAVDSMVAARDDGDR
jgi:gamma-glutamylcyclotransferase (GGCT)/AIG2-like uncharacterized protein YtfP